MFVSLDRVKQHLNIEATYTEDDNYLSFLIEVAEGTVEKHICTNLYDLCKDDGSGNQVLPLPLQHAILLYIGDLYNSREGNAYGVSVSQVPFSYDYLLSLYKNYADTTSEAFEASVIDDAIEHGYFDENGNLLIPTTEETYGLKGRAIKRIRQSLHTNNNGEIVMI